MITIWFVVKVLDISVESNAGNVGSANPEGQTQSQSTSGPTASGSAKSWDPKNCKKKKRSAAKIQEEDLRMRSERHQLFMNKLGSVGENATEDGDGDSDFGRLIIKQMRMVFS